MQFNDDRQIEFWKSEPSSPTSSSQLEDIPSILEGRLNRFLLLGYAIQYWGNHVRTETTPAITSLAVEVLSNERKPHCISIYFHSAIQIDPVNLPSLVRAGYFDLTRLQRAHGLHIAVYFGLTEVLSILLKTSNLGINSKDCYKQTPLDWAAIRGNYECTLLLLGMKTLDLQTAGAWGTSAGACAL